MQERCPLCPRERTCAVQLGMSALGQKRTFCLCKLQSILSPSFWTTGAQRATSAARVRRNFSGFESRTGSMPASINSRWYAGSATAVRVACAIC